MAILRKVKPCGFRVLIKLKKLVPELEKKTEFGIIYELSDPQKEKLKQTAVQEAYVMALGPTAFAGFDDGHKWCKVGDLVQVCKYSGDGLTDIEEGETYRIINDADIQCVFEGEGLI